MKKLLIIDSNSIINRAFYGVRYLSSKDGTPTNAVYGFLNTLFKLIDEVEPDYICTAYDLKAPTFRHKMYDGYKAQRKPMPDGLKVQMPISKEILKAMKIKSFELEGYEADDIIGTVSKICDENGVECYIATGDKDDLQLATDKTKVLLTVTKSGTNETTCYDEKAVFERYRVSPTEFIDIKALMGDPSDNIPGVPGIGEKTATSLIEQFKSIEYIYEHLDEIGLKGATLKKITEGRELAFMSKKLATIIRDVPIDFDFEECRFGGSVSDCATEEAYEILKKLDLNSIIKKLNLSPSKEYKAEIIDIYKDTSFSEIKSQDELKAFLSEIDDKLSFIFEFENSHPSALALANGKKSIYIDFNLLEYDKAAKILNPVFKSAKLYSSNFKEAIVNLWGITAFENIMYDVEIAAYLANPAKSEYSINSLINDYFGINIESSDSEKQLSLFDDNGGAELLCKKALAIEPLAEKTLEILEKNSQKELYFDIELPLVSVLADMEISGIKVDTKKLREFSDMLDTTIKDLTSEIYEYAGEEFNINSPKQLGVILFEKLGLKSSKKTKSGYSTNIEVLEKLRNSHPIIEPIITYRQFTKLKSTYCDGLLAVIDKQTERVHSQFKQTVTLTGRISSTEPNLQNIPTRTALGREMRKMFVAENDGYVLVDADYSQIELRVLAHIANDRTMIDAFINDEDIHSVTASQVLGKPTDEVTPEERSRAKAVNFGIVYGIGDFGLAQDLKISVKDAREYIAGYLKKYSGVKEYMENIKSRAQADGYVKTLMNRIRYIPELKSTNHNIHSFGERVALNTPIQGTAADIIKLAMVRVHKRLKKERLSSKLILQVHDELIVEAPIAEEEQVCLILKEEMENVIKLNVPLIADTNSGYSWYDAK